MKYLIVYAHPLRKSFNHSLLETAVNAIESKNCEYNIIDLYRDHFDPVLTERDLAASTEGRFIDRQAERYSKLLKETDRLILIFPIWWGLMPAILKGFFDKVLLKGIAYEFNGQFPKGLFSNVKKSLVITTMNLPRFYYTMILNRPVYHSITKSVLTFCGIRKIKWIQLSSMKNLSDRRKDHYFKKVYKSVLSL